MKRVGGVGGVVDIFPARGSSHKTGDYVLKGGVGGELGPYIVHLFTLVLRKERRLSQAIEAIKNRIPLLPSEVFLLLPSLNPGHHLH